MIALSFLTAGRAQAYTVAAPTSLDTSPDSHNAIAVSWKPVPGATQYEAQYSTTREMSRPLSVKTAAAHVDVKALKSSTKYWVRVRVVNAKGGALSAWTTAVSGQTNSAKGDTYLPPMDLAPTEVSATTAALSWTSRGSGLRYRVSYAAVGRTAVTREVATTTLTLTGLQAKTAYTARIKVITATGARLSEYSPTTAFTTPAATVPVKVASFNVRCATCFEGLPNELHWPERRDAVVAQIRAQAPDVIGVQEAAQAWMLDANGNKISPSITQFEDLVNRLGDPFVLANPHRNNCVDSTKPKGCVYQDRGASRGTKIIYRSSTLKLVSQGSVGLTPAAGSGVDRYVAWAVFEHKVSGQRFFFADTHLPDEKDDVQVAVRNQNAAEVARIVTEKNTAKLPVVVVGDFNSHKWTIGGNTPYDKMIAAGFSDPLGNAYGTTKTAPGATVEKRIHTTYNSYNGFATVPPSHPTWINGTYIDYIFVKGVRVMEWETVVSVNPDGTASGVIASDHLMIRATVSFP